MRCARYLRVSRADQNPQLQDDQTRDLIERRGWTLTHTYLDHGVSGAKERRPELDRMLKDAKRGRFNVLVVYKSDRLFRSLKNMVSTLDDLRAMGVDFVSVTEPFDSSPSGTLMLQLLGSLAQFERSLLIERTRAGLAAARNRGAKIGRPRVHVDTQRAHQLRAEGCTYREVARALGVGVATLHRALAAQGAAR